MQLIPANKKKIKFFQWGDTVYIKNIPWLELIVQHQMNFWIVYCLLVWSLFIWFLCVYVFLVFCFYLEFHCGVFLFLEREPYHNGDRGGEVVRWVEEKENMMKIYCINNLIKILFTFRITNLRVIERLVEMWTDCCDHTGKVQLTTNLYQLFYSKFINILIT